MACQAVFGVKTKSFLMVQLDQTQKEEIINHYLGLPKEDNKLRFMFEMQADGIKNFTEGMFENKEDYVFGAYVADEAQKRTLAGVSQLTFETDEETNEAVAEIALSVDAAFRRLGIGKAFMQKGMQTAKEKGFKRLKVHCLSTNLPMKTLATTMGAKMQMDPYGDLIGYIPLV